MKEYPILFSAPMVRAILEGRKTQTRRVVKFPRDFDGSDVFKNGKFGLKYSSTNMGGVVERMFPKWEVGDRLWVRETWANVCHSEDGQCYGEECLECSFDYRADNPYAKWAGDWDNGFRGYEVPDGCKWKPSIFMPRVASRISLEITDIRVERLFEITEGDAISEGVEKWPDGNFKVYGKHAGKHTFARDSFLSRWDSINGDQSHAKNPWVWVISFIRL